MSTLKTAVNIILLFTIAICTFQSHASAQSALDMWTQLAEKQGLFSPHADTCDSSTESYITIGNGTLGFCMENSIRTAAIWTVAKQTCAAAGKRLPEPAEFKYACDNAGSYSLSNMTGAYEWISNTTAIFEYYSGGTYQATSVAGNSSCSDSTWGQVMGSAGTPNSLGYRCVR
jgi:hypothetical protein